MQTRRSIIQPRQFAIQVFLVDTDVVMKYLFIGLVFLVGCSTQIVPASKLANELPLIPSQSDDGYVLLRCTILDGETNEVSPGWKITVGHGMFVHSGPPRNEHFGQRFDQDGVFYVCAAPSLNSQYPERLGIEIEANGKDREYFSAAYLVLNENWRDGTWRTPSLRYQRHGDNDGPPRYKLRLERIPPSKTKLGEVAK